MLIATVVGARPQFVKAAVVSRLLRAQPGTREMLIHTGQHFDDDMSGAFFRELDIPAPEVNLGISASLHGAMTGRMLEAVERTLMAAGPDLVLVYGDTNSTLAGALAAAKLNIPIAHVEAGLRSFNRRMPEEVNRVLTDHLSAILLAPTEQAVANLADEGIVKPAVSLVGDVMYDAALAFAARARNESSLPGSLDVQSGTYTLATIHRAENTDHPETLRAIVTALVAESAQRPIIWPIHPRTVKALRSLELLEEVQAHIRALGPVGYLDMIALEQGAELIVTDSGGVQKEAYFFRKPCVTLRGETEWVELVRAGVNWLTPPESAPAIRAGMAAAAAPIAQWPNLYGDGHAGEQVVARLLAP